MSFRKRPTTVDMAIAPLLKSIVDLEGVSDARSKALSEYSESISRLEGLRVTDRNEMERADAVAKMIRSITSPEDATPD